MQELIVWRYGVRVSRYQPDEFDELAKKRQIVGVHLKPESPKRMWFASLAVIVIAIALGIGGTKLYDWWRTAEQNKSNAQFNTASVAPSSSPLASAGAVQSDSAVGSSNSAKPDDSATQDNSPKDASSVDSNGTVGSANNSVDKPSEASSASPVPNEPAPVVNKNSQVMVLNATRINGLARSKAKSLTDSGFSNVTAGNYRQAPPAKTTVFYVQDKDGDTAKEVAKILGISADQVVKDSSKASGGHITVVIQAS